METRAGEAARPTEHEQPEPSRLRLPSIATAIGVGALALLAASGSSADHDLPHAVSSPEPQRHGTRPRFRVSTQEVLVPVTVVAEDGSPVVDLAPEEFRVFEDGVEQTVARVLDGDAPLSVLVALDVSGSMSAKRSQALAALECLLEPLRPADRVLVVEFDEAARLVVDRRGGGPEILTDLRPLATAGGTALFDALVDGLDRLHRIRDGSRRALVLLSDGFDNASVATQREAVAAARATGIPVYAVGLGRRRRGIFSRLFGDPGPMEGRGVDENRLRAISEATGGRAFILAELEGRGVSPEAVLAGAFSRLGRELRSQYVLTYRPRRGELDGRWHWLRVEVRRPDVYVRFRPGYLALALR